MWHVTHDMWHMTCYIWHVTCYGGWSLSQNFSSLALKAYDWPNQLMNDKAVYRTASATQGLLKISTLVYNNSSNVLFRFLIIIICGYANFFLSLFVTPFFFQVLLCIVGELADTVRRTSYHQRFQRLADTWPNLAKTWPYLALLGLTWPKLGLTWPYLAKTWF